MARHLWTMMCQRAIIEAKTGIASLIDLVEILTIDRTEHQLKEDEVAAGQGPVILMSLWEKTSKNEQVSYAKAELWGPPGSENPLAAGAYQLANWTEDKPRLRNIAEIPILPMPLDGRYEFRIFWRATEEADWGTPVASYEFAVKTKDAPGPAFPIPD